MLRSRIVRFASAGLALATPLAIVVSLSGPASASQPKLVLKIKCTGLTGNEMGNVTLSGCNGNTGGSSTPFTANLLGTGGTITWSNGKTTTIGMTTSKTGTACPAGTDTDVILKSTVTAVTTRSVTIGSKSKIEVCTDGSGNITLPPGKKAKI